MVRSGQWVRTGADVQAGPSKATGAGSGKQPITIGLSPSCLTVEITADAADDSEEEEEVVESKPAYVSDLARRLHTLSPVWYE